MLRNGAIINKLFAASLARWVASRWSIPWLLLLFSDIRSWNRAGVEEGEWEGEGEEWPKRSGAKGASARTRHSYLEPIIFNLLPHWLYSGFVVTTAQRILRQMSATSSTCFVFQTCELGCKTSWNYTARCYSLDLFSAIAAILAIRTKGYFVYYSLSWSVTMFFWRFLPLMQLLCRPCVRTTIFFPVCKHLS